MKYVFQFARIMGVRPAGEVLRGRIRQPDPGKFIAINSKIPLANPIFL